MKNQFLTAYVVGMIASLSYVSTGFAVAVLSHESTGSIATSALSTATVSGGTIGTVSTVSGTVTAATAVTINVGPDVVFSSATGGINVTIPSGTTITSASGGTFDATAILATGAIVSSGLGTNEVSQGAIEFGISSVGLHFSDPIKVEIPVPGYTGTTISVKVKHGGTSTFVTTGLTNDPNATCTAGVPSVASATATVASGIATIYTCAASTFTTLTTVTPTVTSGGGGGGGSYSAPLITTTTTYIPTTTSTGAVVLKPTQTKKVIVRKSPTKTMTTTTTTDSEGKTKTTTTVKPVTRSEQVLEKNLFTSSSRVNIYLAADVKAKFLGYLTKNVKVSVLEENGDWIKVTTVTFSGWAKRAQFRLPSEAEAAKILRDADRVIPYVLYTNNGRVNVRSAGDKTAKFLGYFGSKTKVEVIGDSPEWYNITSKWLTGWSKKTDFRDPTPTEDAEIMLSK